MSSKEYKVTGVAGMVKPYVCGGSAAMFASSCIHPIDLIKVRLQLVGMGSATGVRPSALGVAKMVVKEEGVAGLYRGLSASLTRQATYGTARIGLYQAFSDKVKKARGIEGNLPLYWKFATSFTSGAIASAIGNPFDVSLVRMQADAMAPVGERRNYTGVGNAVTRIVREEGFGALYHGYRPTLLRAIAMNVGMMASFDQVKEFITGVNGKCLSTDLMSSAAAGFFCAFASLPFDMMKTRLQNMKALPSGQMPYDGLSDCAVKIFRNEGFTAFWRGFGAFYGRCAPHAMIILLSREQIMKAYDKTLGEEVKSF
jgi:solute carrier family 25 oxoglutarate transporter 11